MNCQKCGSPIIPGDKFCKTCGTAVAVQEVAQPMMAQMPTGMEQQMNNPMNNNINNNMNMQPQQPAQQHPLMMNQADLNMNAMTMNLGNNMNMQQENNMGMNNNQFIPNAMSTPMDNNVNSMNTMGAMDMSNQMNSMNNMNQMGTMNDMSAPMIGMNQMDMSNQMNNMNSLNNGMSSVPTPPPGMAMGMNTPMSIGPMGAVTPQNNNSKFIIAGIAVVVVVLVLAFTLFGNTSNLNEKEVGKGNEEEKEVPTYTVKISGFAFKVPQTYIYEVNNGYLMMTDESNAWVIRLSVQKASYETFKKNIDQIKMNAEKKGYEVETAALKTIGGVEMIKLCYESSGIKNNGAFSKINSMYVVAIDAFNEENTYDDKLLEKAAAIVKTAEYTGETTNMEIAIPDGVKNLLNQQ